ncbi:MAG: S41 family peptidase [Flavobacteriaceae bacterium]
MNNKIKLIFVTILCIAITFSCFEDRDDNGAFASEINDFIWKGMNFWYLYKGNVPDLANDRFSSNEEYADYLNLYSNPPDLFESLIYDRPTTDKYSVIVEDYIALEQLFSGVTTRSGIEIDFYLVPGSSTDVFGIVRLVLPNSNADTAGLERGQLFYGVNGTPLNTSNLNTLFGQDSYEINLATYNDNGTPETTDDSIIQGSETVTLTKMPYSENPIFKTEILDVEGENVGYLMYNGFISDFNSQLNSVFANFKANNVQHLVLDLRYNPGGRVDSSILLASLVTGQFTGEIHSTEQWNSEWQEAFFNDDPENLINRFPNTLNGAPINSLFLDKVYVLTTGDSASASELLINSLNPYIDVVQIGTATEGKFQGSITLYDSDDFQREGANPNHTYAMQPLVVKYANSVGTTDFVNGLTPDIVMSENPQNYGILGDENEPLLARALLEIAMTNAPIMPNEPILPYKTSNTFEKFSNEMFIDKELPKDVIKRLKFNQ